MSWMSRSFSTSSAAASSGDSGSGSASAALLALEVRQLRVIAGELGLRAHPLRLGHRELLVRELVLDGEGLPVVRAGRQRRAS